MNHLRLTKVSKNANWMTLETYTSAFVQLFDIKVQNGAKKMFLTLPKALSQVIQTEVGSIDQSMFASTTILKLVQGHPVIDHILYDPTANIVYFIQTSSSPYDKHGKKIENLKD